MPTRRAHARLLAERRLARPETKPHSRDCVGWGGEGKRQESARPLGDRQLQQLRDGDNGVLVLTQRQPNPGRPALRSHRSTITAGLEVRPGLHSHHITVTAGRDVHRGALPFRSERDVRAEVHRGLHSHFDQSAM